jgi:hypothetical protein
MLLQLIQARTALVLLALHGIAFAINEISPKDVVATDGAVVSHLFPACNGKRVGGPKVIQVPVDRCMTTPGFAVEIKKAAVCANGTRAQVLLIRFPLPSASGVIEKVC